MNIGYLYSEIHVLRNDTLDILEILHYNYAS
jgi:hypothetical protein